MNIGTAKNVGKGVNLQSATEAAYFADALVREFGLSWIRFSLSIQKRVDAFYQCCSSDRFLHKHHAGGRCALTEVGIGKAGHEIASMAFCRSRSLAMTSKPFMPGI